MDGNATISTNPWRRLAGRRASQSLPWCTPNTWGETGKPRAASGTPIFYTYAKSGARVASCDHPPQRQLDFPERRVQNRAPRIDHDVPLRTDFGPMQTKSLPQPAFDPVTDHGPADRSGHGEPQTRSRLGFRSAPRQAKGREQWTGEADALFIDLPKIGGAQNAGRPGKRTALGRTLSFRPWRNGRSVRR